MRAFRALLAMSFQWLYLCITFESMPAANAEGSVLLLSACLKRIRALALSQLMSLKTLVGSH